MTRVYNFGAGPAALPEEVLQIAKEELLDWNKQGMSIVEVSHRSKAFQELMQEAEQDLRALLNISQDYSVLFLAGPTRAQFSMVPLNLMGNKGKAAYIDTGIWSHMALEEAHKYGEASLVCSGESSRYTSVPERNTWNVDTDAAYCHYCANETINGVEFHEIPEVGNLPLVADVTSTLLSRPLDVNRFGLLYAGSQKNIGPSGLVVVIVRKDLLGKALPITPQAFDYRLQDENQSLLYTPTTFACYMAGLVFKWLKAQGGLKAMAERNQRKAEMLYAAIDNSDFYHNPVDPRYRSWMNIPFTLADQNLEETFLKEARLAHLVELKGHRYVGGMRASIYNAMPEEGVEALVHFMKAFERKNG